MGGPVWKTLFLRLQEPCKRAFRAASHGRRPAGGCTKVETAWLLGWATGIKAVSLEPGNPAHAKICVNPHQKSRNKGDIRRCSGRDFGTALSLPANAGAIPTPAMSLGHVDLSLLGQEKWRSLVAQLLQGDLFSQRAGQTRGDAGKLDVIYPDVLKAYRKSLCIRLFRNQRHYREIRNWLGDGKSRVGINI